MKKVLMALTAIGMISLTACSSDDEGSMEQELEGQWTYEEAEYESDEPHEDTVSSGNQYTLFKVEMTGGNGAVDFQLDPNKTMPSGENDFNITTAMMMNGDTMTTTTIQASINLIDEGNFSVESNGRLMIYVMGSQTEMEYNISGDELTLTKADFDFGSAFGQSSAKGNLSVVLKRM
ncbi:MAG: hypothetical protein JJU02_12645 [Cryomorphaceae bacterium]|nr:hypothetical protein [Cryomorphaceae bacterium]